MHPARKLSRFVGASCAAVLALTATAAVSAPITYTMTGTVSGTLGGTPFTSQPITLSTVGDTTAVQYYNVFGLVPIYENFGTTTFDIGGSTGTLIGTFAAISGDYTFFSPNAATLGIGLKDPATGQGPHLLLQDVALLTPHYDLTTPTTRNSSGWATSTLNTVYNTSVGDLVITSVNGPSVFTAAFGPSPSPVPEIDPAGMGSVLALVGGGIGLLERRRRKTA